MRSLLLLGLLVGPAHAAAVSRGCSATVQQAAAQMASGESNTGEQTGFRVEHVRVDRVQGGVWAMVGSCADPARPLVAVKLPESAGRQVAASREIVIHAGERVRVIQRSGDSHMELSGSADDAGAVGAAVRVRLDSGLFGGDGVAAHVRGRVVKAGVVEVDQ